MSDQQQEQTTLTLSEQWNQAVGQVESSPIEAVEQLEKLQRDVAALALFSPNETLEDVSSKSLPLLSLNYYLAMALLAIPTPSGHASERMANLKRAMDLFSSFLARLEQYELLTKQDAKEYQDLLLDTAEEDDNKVRMPSRDEKIARHRAKQEAQQELQRLQAFKSRRGRLEIDNAEEVDGYDEESLERSLGLQLIQIHASQALEEWHSAKREVPMVQMMLKMESLQRGDGQAAPEPSSKPRPPPSNKPLEVTHITQDSATGQLNIRKEEIRSQVFRPSWNQPTMSLQQLAELEVRQAQEREAQADQAQQQRTQQPRRYDQLVQDGMEDDADLVDASAAKDRAWDDFKDANPRGSGNKMGDRGDRNF